MSVPLDGVPNAPPFVTTAPALPTATARAVPTFAQGVIPAQVVRSASYACTVEPIASVYTISPSVTAVLNCALVPVIPTIEVWSPVLVPVTLPLRVPLVIVAPFIDVAVATPRDGVVNDGDTRGAFAARAVFVGITLSVSRPIARVPVVVTGEPLIVSPDGTDAATDVTVPAHLALSCV